MKRSTVWKTLTTGVFLTSIATSAVFYNMNATSAERYEQQITQKTDEIRHLKEDMAGLDKTIQNQSDLLDSRKDFVESLTNARTVLSEAGKRGNVEKSASLIKDAEETAFQERTSSLPIMVQTAKVNKEVSKVRGAVGLMLNTTMASQVIDEGELGFEVENLKTLPADHPARLALDAVGGTDVRLGSAKNACNNEQAVACAFNMKIILIDERYVNDDYDQQYLVMMHEYAHQIQYAHMDAMKYSKGFNELFSQDIEWLADCMAAAKIDNYSSGYHYKCSPDQKEYGAKAWSGVFS